MTDVMPRNKTGRARDWLKQPDVDYRALTSLPAEMVRAARERWLLQGEDMDAFADEAARHARRHGSLANFPPTAELAAP